MSFLFLQYKDKELMRVKLYKDKVTKGTLQLVNGINC